MKIAAFLSLVLLSTIGQAQDNMFWQKAQYSLDIFNDRFEPETVDLVTDREFYFTGDRIWYALTLNNSPYAPGSLSILAYVELRDQYDSVLFRQKVRCKEGMAHGEISLPHQLTTGYYKLTAFTLWMTNVSPRGFCSRNIPVINLLNPAVKSSGEALKKQAAMMEIERTGPVNFRVKISPGLQGTLVAASREEIFAVKTASAGQEILLECQSVKDDHLYISLVADDGSTLVEQLIMNDNIHADLLVTTNRKEYTTRGSVALSLDLKDKLGIPVEGTVSISVRPVTKQTMDEPVSLQWTRSFGSRDQDPVFRREVFIYPAVKGSLQPLPFSVNRAGVPGEFAVMDPEIEKMLVAAEMKRKIAKAYGTEVFYDPENNYNLSFNNSYEPRRYTLLPSLEDFLREIVPQVRVRSQHGEKVIRLRNSDNSAAIFFYKKSPLLLVDGFVLDSASEFLSIPLIDIEKVDVLWGTQEINALGVYALADNGVLSLTTKSGTARIDRKNQLFKAIHTPLKYSLPMSSDKQGPTPLLVDPVYWNPGLRLKGRARLSVPLSDEQGEFEVVVKGLTRSGSRISDRTVFKVTGSGD